MRVGDKQYGNLDLNQNDITNIGDVQKSLSSAVAFWKLIQEISLPEDAATIEFNGIPQNFRHLILVVSARSTEAAVTRDIGLRFNGDTGNNYDAQHTTVNDSATLASSGSDGPGVQYIHIAEMPAANGPADPFTPCTVFILDYANISRHKSVVGQFGYLAGTTAGDIYTGLSSGRWRNTNAITSITLLGDTGNFKSGSMASLYGTDV